MGSHSRWAVMEGQVEIKRVFDSLDEASVTAGQLQALDFGFAGISKRYDGKYELTMLVTGILKWERVAK